MKAVSMGDLHLDLPNGSKRTPVIFKNAVHAPKMAFTLLSISKLDKSDHRVVFHKQMCTISDSKGRTIAKIPHSEGLYCMQAPEQPKIDLIANAAVIKMSINEAHRCLGHISSAAIKHAIAKGFITGIDLDKSSKPDFCEACVKAKLARQPFPQESETQADKYREYVHWDLWGPASVKSLNGHYYVAAQIDDTTRETRLYFQEKKSETFSSYKKDEAYIETQTRNRIKTVRSNCRGEFMSAEFIKYQDSRGTVRQLTIHDSPQQNSIAERGMRTRAERAHAMLILSGLPRFLWEEAMHHTTWLQNRMSACTLDRKTPFEMKLKRKPNLANVCEFGAAAYVKNLKAGKLDSRALVGRFVGYDIESKGYRIYWPTKRSISVEETLFSMKMMLHQQKTLQVIYWLWGRGIKTSNQSLKVQKVLKIWTP